MPAAIVNSGDQVLFVAPSSSDQTHLMNARSAFQNQVGSEGAVAFEAMERVSEGIMFPIKLMTTSIDLLISIYFSTFAKRHI
jgi:hypothetical protein